MKKRAIKADIKAAWEAQDELAIQLAAKHSKKVEWMRVRVMRHGGPKNSRKTHRVSAWNTFLHYHSCEVNEGMYIRMHAMSSWLIVPFSSPSRCKKSSHGAAKHDFVGSLEGWYRA